MVRVTPTVGFRARVTSRVRVRVKIRVRVRVRVQEKVRVMFECDLGLEMLCYD